PAPPGVNTLSLHDALPILIRFATRAASSQAQADNWWTQASATEINVSPAHAAGTLEFTTLQNLTLGVTYYFGAKAVDSDGQFSRSEEHTSELQSRFDLVCR